MSFDLNIHLQALEQKYTEESIKKFLSFDWSKCKYPTEQSWEAFVKYSTLLKEKKVDEAIVWFENIPYLNISYETYINFKNDGIEFTDHEKNVFEAHCIYLIDVKKLSIETIKDALHKISSRNKPFLETFTKQKTFQTEDAKRYINKLIEIYGKENLENVVRDSIDIGKKQKHLT